MIASIIFSAFFEYQIYFVYFSSLSSQLRFHIFLTNVESLIRQYSTSLNGPHLKSRISWRREKINDFWNIFHWKFESLIAKFLVLKSISEAFIYTESKKQGWLRRQLLNLVPLHVNSVAYKIADRRWLIANSAKIGTFFI